MYQKNKGLAGLITLRGHHEHTVAFTGKTGGEWKSFTYGDYEEISGRLAGALHDLKIAKGDRIFSITNNRPEWNFLDRALMLLGAVHVSIHPSNNTDDLKYILKHSGCRLAFVSSSVFFMIISGMKDELPDLEDVYSFDPASPRSIMTLISGNATEIFPLNGENEDYPDITASICYTSGTTAFPKGAMIPQKAFTRTAKFWHEIFQLKPGEKSISFLPLSHTFERTLNYMYQYAGATVVYADQSSGICKTFMEHRPDMFACVPLLITRLFEEITSELGQSVVKRLLLYAARFDKKSINRYFIPSWYVYHFRYFRKIRKLLGEKLKYISSGGAAMPVVYIRFFRLMGIRLFECYGMTEMNIISVNSRKYGYKDGTAGVPVKGADVRFGSDGEVQVKSPYMMENYYRYEGYESEVFTPDGYFITGDIGQFVNKKFLKITGRKSEVFKNAAGVFINPPAEEMKLKANQLIRFIMIVGKDRDYLGALIVPNLKTLSEKISHSGTGLGTELIGHPVVVSLFQAILDDYNKDKLEPEMIGCFRLVFDNWSVETGELTSSLKLRRNVILKKYEPLIENMYQSKQSI